MKNYNMGGRVGSLIVLFAVARCYRDVLDMLSHARSSTVREVGPFDQFRWQKQILPVPDAQRFGDSLDCVLRKSVVLFQTSDGGVVERRMTFISQRTHGQAECVTQPVDVDPGRVNDGVRVCGRTLHGPCILRHSVQMSDGAYYTRRNTRCCFKTNSIRV